MNVVKKIYLFLLDTVQTLLLAASVFLVIYMFLFRPFQVSGESMYPTFQDKEYILTNIVSLYFSDPKQGDVVVFKAPTDPDKDFIKRVIAAPSDTISVQDGYVYVNNKRVDEVRYLDTSVRTNAGSFLKEGEVLTVPDGQYVVMGDNRSYSSDFREWGFLPKKAIIGKSFLVYWPLNHMRRVTNPFN